MTIDIQVKLSLSPDDPLVSAVNGLASQLSAIRDTLAASDADKADLATAVKALEDLKGRFDEIDPASKP